MNYIKALNAELVFNFNGEATMHTRTWKLILDQKMMLFKELLEGRYHIMGCHAIGRAWSI